MQGSTPVEHVAIKDIVERIFSEGHLTYSDRQCLKTALLDETIADDELALIEQIIAAVRKGDLCIS